MQRERAILVELPAHRVAARDGGDVDAGTDFGRLEDVTEIAREPVGDVERGGGDAAQGLTQRHPRLGTLEAHTQARKISGRQRREVADLVARARRLAGGVTANPAGAVSPTPLPRAWQVVTVRGPQRHQMARRLQRAVPRLAPPWAAADSQLALARSQFEVVA